MPERLTKEERSRNMSIKRCTMPINNAEFWKKKFAANIKRDNSVREALKKCGWQVIIIWECEILDMDFPPKLFYLLRKGNPIHG